MADTAGGLQLQVRQALALPPNAALALHQAIAPVGRLLQRIVEQLNLEAGSLSTYLHARDSSLPEAVDPLLALIQVITEQDTSSGQELLRRLDQQLSDTWRDLDENYERHQLRQAHLVNSHLEHDEMEAWILPELDVMISEPDEVAEPEGEYPAEEIETALRLRSAICHMVSGIRATLGDQEHEGWIHFELALLLVDELKRRHAQDSQWAQQEIARATAEGDRDELEMCRDYQRLRESRFRRWWQLYGPVYSWLTERLELAPSGLDRVFDAIGEDVWEMSMLELIDRARDILV